MFFSLFPMLTILTFEFGDRLVHCQPVFYKVFKLFYSLVRVLGIKIRVVFAVIFVVL